MSVTSEALASELHEIMAAVYEGHEIEMRVFGLQGRRFRVYLNITGERDGDPVRFGGRVVFEAPERLTANEVAQQFAERFINAVERAAGEV